MLKLNSVEMCTHKYKQVQCGSRTNHIETAVQTSTVLKVNSQENIEAVESVQYCSDTKQYNIEAI